MEYRRSKAKLTLFSKRVSIASVLGAALCGFAAEPPKLSSTPVASLAEPQAVASSGNLSPDCVSTAKGSPYINLDNWVYPAVLRLYSLGFVDHVFLNLRPWTRANLVQIFNDVSERIQDGETSAELDQAEEIYNALAHELRNDTADVCGNPGAVTRLESAYTVARGITGNPLRDSFHLGSSVINDYGRPYQNGFNNYTGVSGYATAGRYSLYARGEFQGAPSAVGYSPALAQLLSNHDMVPYLNPLTGLPYNQATIPQGPISSSRNGRVMEAYVSALVLNHEISFGKQDQWMGPGVGGAFAYSNNAENIYAFEINRTEPLRIPALSRITGPFRYEFLVGSLKGHVAPNDPWMHAEKVSFRPTANLELGFERTVIWGGKGHVPITLHSFLKSFFSFQNVSAAEKFSRSDPGARFGAFDFSYRVPFARKYLTVYADGEVHDDVSPIDAPRRASWRPGIYMSHVPGIPRLDLRMEAVTTDPPVSTSNSGRFMYWEAVQVQGYTNKGQIFGDWIGREAKGGQAWITYHLSGNEWIQVSVRNQKDAKDFIQGNGLGQSGTTLNDIGVQVVKRVGPDFEINGSFTYERYKAPVYLANQQTVTNTNIQLTWYPGRKVNF